MTTSEYILDPRFRMLGIGVKVDDQPSRYFSDAAGFFAQAKPFLEKSAVLAHHAHFDGLIMSRYAKVKPALWYDTLSMARCIGLNVNVGGSLAALMAHFGLGEKAPLRPDASQEELRARALGDVEGTYKLFHCMVGQVPLRELQLIDWTVRCFTEPVLRLDLERAIELERDLTERKQAILDDLGVDAKMLGSDVQFAALLEQLGVEPPMKPSPSDPTKFKHAFAKTDKAMQELAEHDDPQVQALVAARLDTKSTGDQTRVRRLIQTYQACGRLVVYLNHAGAHTLRWSGGDGQNWQNFSKPRKDARGTPVEGTGVIKKCIVAPPGHTLVVGDLSQIEARITAWLAGQWDMVEAFREGRDLYCEFGTDLYKRTITKADTLERFVSKTAVLGAGFGCGWQRFKDEVRRKGHVEIEDATARRTINGYRARFSQIPHLWTRCEHLINNPGARVGPVISEGDRLLFPDGMYIYYHDLQRRGRDWSIQTRKGRAKLWGGLVLENVAQRLARIIAASAILELRNHFPVPTMSHDELVGVVPEDRAEWGVQLMEQQLTHVPFWATGWGEHEVELPLAAEVHAGRVYGDVKS